MPKQLLYCPTCRTLVQHLVEPVPEGDVAWCLGCRQVHLVADPKGLPRVTRTPRPPCWE